MIRKTKIRHLTSLWMAAVMVLFSLSGIAESGSIQTKAADVTVTPGGYIYTFGENSNYEISSSGGSSMNGSGYVGKLTITGNFTDTTSNGKSSYDVKDGVITFSYERNLTALYPSTEDNWNLESDNKKAIDGIELGAKIQSGALIVQTSLDGINWVTDTVMTDVFSKGSNTLAESFYSAKDIQLINGCYYRVTVAYAQKILQGTRTYAWVNVNNYDHRKVAEVYEFYAVNSAERNSSNANATPKVTLGSAVNTGKDNGFSGNNVIDSKDPHYGWNIGSFFVNGYTRDMTDEHGNTVFLKNVGDKVTLWFNLAQNIYSLNGNDKVFINEDTNGYDQYFQTAKTNFRRGTLIIQYTNREGVKQTPVIYTDFLAACATTGANTRAVLFEEGDYEVSLDYEICDSTGINSYTDYKIFFSFSIRNGNCMAFPFDISTGAEMVDNAITPNGFRLDLARSRYLDIQVTRSVLQNGTNGRVEDVRFNRPAKDGDEYTDEGIYKIDVTNRYTGEHTVKILYVGTDEFLRAMSATGLSVREIESYLAEGARIGNNGELIMPTPEPTVTPEPEVTEVPEPEATSEPESTPEVTQSPAEITAEPVIETTPVPTDTPYPVVDASEERQITSTDVDVEETEETTPKKIVVWPFVLLIVIVGGVVGFFKKNQGTSKKVENNAGNITNAAGIESNNKKPIDDVKNINPYSFHNNKDDNSGNDKE